MNSLLPREEFLKTLMLSESTLVNDLKVGEIYIWTAGSEPLEVKYIGLASEHPDKKAASSLGKGYLFKFLDGLSEEDYVELSAKSVNDVIELVE